MKCPHCLVTVFLKNTLHSLGHDKDGAWLADCSTCPHCSRLIVYICRYPADSIHFSTAGLRTTKPASLKTLVYPKSIQRNPPPPQVPREFAKDYFEAACIINESPKASAALSRRLLQHILREKAGATQRNLVGAIQHVVKEQSVPSYISESLDTLRELGNFATHPTRSVNTAEIIEVEPEEANWCLDVIDLLYDHYFVAPDKARQAKEAMNAKRIAANRDPLP